MVDTSTIQRRISMIRKLEEEIKVAKDALKQALENDSAYVTANDEAKTTTNKKKVIKDQIWNQDGNRALLEDVKVNTEEIATLQEILNAELIDYARTNNTDEIQDESGNTIKFKMIVKLQRPGFTEQP